MNVLLNEQSFMNSKAVNIDFKYLCVYSSVSSSMSGRSGTGVQFKV